MEKLGNIDGKAITVDEKYAIVGGCTLGELTALWKTLEGAV
jgi:hypothetical protein